MHKAGFVHGDITPRNVLLKLEGIDGWSVEDMYHQLGHPRKDTVMTDGDHQLDSSAPRYLVEPTSFPQLELRHLSEQALLIDLGEAFDVSHPPPQGVGTPAQYRSPELLLENKASNASDVWALACTIFEMRAGFPLFESFLGSPGEVLQEISRILGPPPESSRGLWEQEGIKLPQTPEFTTAALDDRVNEIGSVNVEDDTTNDYMHDDVSSNNNEKNRSLFEHALLEPKRCVISADEAESLADLMRRALDYRPEKRLFAEEMAKHPWLQSP